MEYTETCIYLEVLSLDTFAWKYGPLPWDQYLVTYEYLNDQFYPVVWKEHHPVQTTQQFFDQAYQQLQDGVMEAHYEADDDGALYAVDHLGYRTLLCMTSSWGRVDELAYAMNQTFPKTDTKAFHQAQREAAEQRMAQVIRALQVTGCP